jgi:Bacterial capsule synthesis protein PGA_cap
VKVGAARRVGALVVLLVAVCGRPAPAPGPAPVSSPVAAPTPSAANPDTNAVARRDSLGEARVTAAGGVRVCAGGDVTLGTDLDTSWVRRTAGQSVALDTLISPVRALVADADLVMVNSEGAIGDGPLASAKCTHKAHCFMLRQPPEAAAALRGLGDSVTVVVANLANNHAHDAGAGGFGHTAAALTAAGIHVTGADTEATLVVSARGDTVAILGFSAWSTPGVQDLDDVRRLVARAAARTRRVIVTMHIGAEGHLAQRTGDSTEHYAGENRGNAVAFAHAAVDAGATLVIGHGPHVLRASEWRGDALILYSLGNLVNYGPFNLVDPMRRGAIVCTTLDTAGHPSAVLVQATVQWAPGVVSIDTSHRAMTLIDSLSRLDFPQTGVAVDSATGAVNRRSPSAVGGVGGSRVGLRRGRDRRIIGGEEAPGAAPRFDLVHQRAIEAALDDAAGDARRLHEVPVADVDADVRDGAMAERQEIAWLERSRVTRDRCAGLGLEACRPGQVDMEGGHDVLHETTAVEAVLG